MLIVDSILIGAVTVVITGVSLVILYAELTQN